MSLLEKDCGGQLNRVFLLFFFERVSVCLGAILGFYLSAAATRREIFSNSHWIEPKSDCIYHAPINLETSGCSPFGVSNQLENGKFNLISVWFNNNSKRFLCVQEWRNYVSLWRELFITILTIQSHTINK